MRFAFSPVYDAAMRLLPARLNSLQAQAMLIAIGLQESQFEHRRQLGDGPARGFWQFEQGGVRGVLDHKLTKPLVTPVLHAMLYAADVWTVWNAIEHNDILACTVARLNLYWLPQALPGPGDVDEAWRQYTFAWRPGKPRRHTWADNYAQAWQWASSAA